MQKRSDCLHGALGRVGQRVEFDRELGKVLDQTFEGRRSCCAVGNHLQHLLASRQEIVANLA